MRWDILGRFSALPRVILRQLRFPGVALALVAAAAVIAVSAVGGALYVDDAGDAALAQIAGGSPLLTLQSRGIITDHRPEQVTLSPDTPETWALVPSDLDATRITRSVRGFVPQALAPGVVVQTTEDVTVDPGGGRAPESARLLAREGFQRHVEVVAGDPEAEGVWLPRSAAERLGAEPGDRMALYLASDPSTAFAAPLAGVYADFDRTAKLPSFWLSAVPLLQGRYGGEAVHLPQPILCSPELLFRLAGTLGAGQGERTGDVLPGLAGTVDYSYGPPAARRLERSAAQAVEIERLLKTYEGYASFAGLKPASELPGQVRRARAVQSSLAPGVETVGLAGQALGVVLAGVAGAYGARRRRTELLLRYVQGRSALELGGLLALEAIVPLLVGGLLGWVGAVWLVGAAGPSGVGPPWAAALAAGGGLRLGLVLALVAVAVSGWSVIRRTLPEWTGVWEGRLAKPPWELLVLGLAAAALYEVLARGQPLFADPDQPPQVDRLLVLLPMLLVAGLAGLFTRAAGRFMASPRARRSTFGVRRSPVAFLAMRRLTSATRATLALATAATVAFGVLAYALTVGASVRGLGADKVRTWVGSDVAVQVAAWPDGGRRDTLAERGAYTAVERAAEAHLAEDGTVVDLLAIDPKWFEPAVYWDPSFSATPLRELLARLGAPGGNPSEVPAILVGLPHRDGASLRFDVEHSLTVRFVGEADLFPGIGTGGRPLVVVSAERLHEVATVTRVPLGMDELVWGKGTAAPLVAAVDEVQIGPVSASREAAETQRLPAVLAVRWTFQPLSVFGVLAGLVALAGLVLYLQSRATARTVSYALARRMGLRRRPHMLATALEIAGLLLAPVAVGSVLAWVSAWLVLPMLDPLPALPPAPVPVFPLGALGLLLLGVIIGSLLVAWLIQRRLDRADVGEVLRLAT